MKLTKNKAKVLFILIFVLFFNPLIIQAMPRGTILYKTSENGKMYGYNDYYEFSLIPGKAHFGGVGIYIGDDKLNNNEPMIIEVDYNGVRMIPVKYFVDLDKGEKFIGAKIPTILIELEKMPDQMAVNITNQIGEGFDFTYHKQKGPQSGDWTPAGFIEKIYESAESNQLAYHKTSIGDVLTYSINITQDGYDNESEINAHHDVFSERLEYSKIHTLSQGDFWEQFFNKEVQDTLNLITNRAEQEQDILEKDDMQKWEDELKGKPVKDKDIAEDYNYAANLEKFSKIAKEIKDIISVTIYGREYEENRYFFFPYTQFQQKTLMHVEIDPSEVSSHGKAEAVGGLSLTQQRVMMTTAFFERLVYALVIEKGKEVVMNFLGIGKIISSINAVKTSIGVGEEGMQLLSGGKVDVDTEKMVKKALSKNEYAQAALSFKKDADEFYQAGINESLEFFDLVNKGHLKKGGEFQRILDLELARISGEDEEIIDTRPVVRQLGDVIDVTPIDTEKEIEKELKKLENQKIEDIDLQKLKELIDDSPQDSENKPDEVEPHQQEQEEQGQEKEIEESLDEPLEEPLEGPTFQEGDVVINEFMANPNSGESEWIELYNKTGQSIDLSDWTIEDNTGPSFGSGSGKKFLKEISISSKDFFVLTKAEHFNLNLNNSGDIIILKHKDNIIDQVGYGDFDDGNTSDNAPGLEKGQALARIQDGQDTNQDNNDWFVTTTPTQSLINQITAPIIETIQTTQPQVSYGGGGGGSSSPSYQAYQTGDIVINEIMYNASGVDENHEWLETYNPGSSEIDLNGWKFYEAETNHNLILKQGDWILVGGAYAVMADDADQFLLDYSSFSGTLFDSSFSLNNTSEIIAIKDGQGNIINELTYLGEWGGDGDGNSIEKKSDGTWEQSSSANGTPGQENSAKQVVDTDSDGVVDTEDNCPNIVNANQADEDSDGVGNVCDDDYEEAIIDNTAPVISNVLATNITYNSATISWNTDENSNSQVEYGLTTSYGSSTTLDTNVVTNHSQNITGLNASTLYHYRVKSKDNSDNQVGSDDATFTTLVTPDTTPPTAEISGQPSNPTNQITTDITVNGDDVIFYKYKLDNGEYGNETVVATHITLSGLSDAEHTIYIIGKDTAGNWQEDIDATSHIWTINTTEPISSIDDPGSIFNAASLPGTVGGDISSDTEQVEIQIKRGENSDYLDNNDDPEWHADRDDLWITKGVILDKENNTWSYNLLLDLLKQQDNKYFIRSRAKDGSGNIQSNYSEINFVFDKTPPGQVVTSDIREKDSPLDLEFFWSGISDFSGIDHYEIEWNSGNTTSTAGIVFRLTGENRTDYSFKVKACDKAGNCGGFSNPKKRRIQTQSLVINEIQVADNEFIELYNPTNENISLDNWYFAYYSQDRDWDKSYRLKQFPNNAVIKSKNYYLIGLKGFDETRGADWQVYSSNQLSNESGSVVIYSSDPREKLANILQKQYIDAVAWGNVSYVKEGDNSASASAENKSLERNVDQGADTDDNAEDFSLQVDPSPQNSQGYRLNKWLNGWDKRKILVVDNKDSANSLEDYQIKIDITHEAEMQSDFSDVRFTSSNGQTLLSYYRETYTEATSAVFWVKIPSILAYSELIIFQYYGNNSINNDDIVYSDCNKNGGCGQNVFEFFDDFSTIRVDDYDYLNASWSIPGYVRFHKLGTDDYGYISPKNLEMKNFYVKTKMFLEKKTDIYLTEGANQVFIDYRHSDNNGTPDNFDDDDYWQFGINNTTRNNSYRGLHFDKNIYTENIGQATNILKYDATMSNYFDKWGVYEARVYETNHQVDFTDEDSQRTTWNLATHYLNQAGRIYLRGSDINGGSWVQVDYLMIAKHSLPVPIILTDKSEGYTVASVQARDAYAAFLNWDNRKTITITNVTNTTSTDPLVDYPVKIETNYLTGMNTDFSDVRFIDPLIDLDDPERVLKYWNESYIDDTLAVFWAKVPSIPANGTKTIYMYYNNPSATYIGNGEDVFIWFDDFETYRQSEYNQFNAVWHSKEGYVKFYSTGSATNYGYLNPKDLQMKDLYIKARMKLTTVTAREANQALVDYRYQDTDNYWRFGLNQKGSYNYRGVNLESNEGGSPFLEAYYKDEQFWDEWDTYEIWAADNSHKVRFTDANERRIVDWEKSVPDTLNQIGDIYLRGSELESTAVYTLLDYLIIAPYKEPEIDVSIDY